MGKVVFNGAVASISGKVEGLVFRQVHGQTIVAGLPEPSEKPPTRAQELARKRFTAAQAYMKVVMADPLQREAYNVLAKLLKRRADKIVAGDFLNPPMVQRIDASAYRGRPGDVISVLAVDDVEVVSVEVILKTPLGTVLERGPAAKVHGVWRYSATLALPPDERITILAAAKDRPGHEGRGELAYP